MNRREALIGLNLIADIGSRQIKSLLDVFGDPREAFGAARGQLRALPGVTDKIINAIGTLKPERIEREIEEAQKLALNIVTCEDDGYPQVLRSIYDPPAVLYVKGRVSLLRESSIAVVGSRRATFYGQKYARQFARELSENGWCIVSGMARGIDTCAHQGALEGSGRTIAVMGSGFRHIYPAQNSGLAEEISREGAVVTEYPLDTPGFRQNFPRRNRIISGLSQAVVVIEAARNSGALITADCALEQSREVCAVPGSIDSATSCGTNELIRQGAHMVLCTADILDIVRLEKPLERPAAQIEQPPLRQPERQPAEKARLNEDERVLYRLFRHDACGIDELIEKSGMDISRISGILVNLQLKKVIKQLPAQLYQLL